MLPETEWPGRAVTVLEVSVETMDNGLGMYSNVSENPTLFRTAGLGVWSGIAAGGEGSESISSSGSGAGAGAVMPTSTFFSGAGNLWSTGRCAASGLAGALFPFALGLAFGMIMDDRSWLEMAAERR